MRSDLSRQLNLSWAGREDLAVFTFGSSNRPRQYQCRKVAKTLRSRFQSSEVTLEALEVPEVCTVNGPSLEAPTVAMLHDSNLPVADEPEEGQLQTPTISVLVGSDQYWRLPSGRVERFNENLCAVETVFGWVLQGPYAKEINLHVINRSASALVLASIQRAGTLDQLVNPPEMRKSGAIQVCGRSYEKATDGVLLPSGSVRKTWQWRRRTVVQRRHRRDTPKNSSFRASETLTRIAFSSWDAAQEHTRHVSSVVSSGTATRSPNVPRPASGATVERTARPSSGGERAVRPLQEPTTPTLIYTPYQTKKHKQTAIVRIV